MQAEEKNRFLISALQLFLDTATEMVFLKDADLVYVAASRSFARMVGKQSGEELAGMTDFDLFPLELAKKYTEDDRRVLTSRQNVEAYIEPLPDQNGKKSYSSTSKYVLYNEAGEVAGLYGMAYDVTLQMELERERESGQLSRQMFDVVLEADLTENRVVRVEGSSWGKLLDLSKHPTYTKTARCVQERYVHPEYREAFAENFALARRLAEYEMGVEENTFITYSRTEREEYRWLEFNSRTYHSRVSNTLRMTTFLRDVDEAVRSKQRLEQRAETDALTGLSNRDHVSKRVTAALAEAPAEQQCAMLFLDLDGFKRVNDQWGHNYGDIVLRRVAKQLRSLFRAEDIFGRIGGDEFVVFFPKVSSRALVERRGKQVVEALDLRREESEMYLNVTCSVGVAFGQCGQTTSNQLYQLADRAMYKAKELGGNQVFFDEDLELT